MTALSQAHPCPPVEYDDDERAARTRVLFAELHRADGDQRQPLLEEIACLHLDLTYRLATRYRRRGVCEEELRQVASVGLMKAIHGFRPELERDFTSYAIPTIMGEIKRFFRDKCWTVKPTRRIQELQANVISRVHELEQQLGRAPYIGELADELDETPSLIGEAMAAGSCYTPRSLDARLDADTESSFLSVIGQDDPEFDRAELHHMLATAMARLPERDRQIIGMRFFDECTQRQIAERIGVTQMQVSRLLGRIMASLRAELTARPQQRRTAHRPVQAPALRELVAS